LAVMKEFLFSPQGWALKKPKLIISIAGSSRRLHMQPQLKKSFKKKLIKAAMSTNAWIITNGVFTGVTRLVGEAVADEFHHERAKVTVLGVASWGKIGHHDKLINRKLEEFEQTNNRVVYQSQQETDLDLFVSQRRAIRDGTEQSLLDPNHTHFILVDDGSRNQAGKETEFRCLLENEVRGRGGGGDVVEDELTYENLGRVLINTKNSEEIRLRAHLNAFIPMVLLVVQGGRSTLDRVANSIENNVPVLVLEVGCGV
jgi:transient receptor potential cation channel subfamily M protein 2